MANSRHALISGGSSGIGLALAHRLARKGWNLTLLARDPERLQRAKTALEAESRTVQVHLVTADVRDAPAVTAATEGALRALGAPDLVVASAGIVIPGLFANLPPQAFDETMAVNYFGTLHLIKAVLPAMRARRSGHDVLISSGAGLIGLYGYTAYAPSKFAIRGLAEALRGELKPEGIGVSIVYPPDTDTPQLTEEIRVRPEITSKLAGGARVHSADEVAQAILKGVEQGRFTIAPGWEMGALSRLHSLIRAAVAAFFLRPGHCPTPQAAAVTGVLVVAATIFVLGGALILAASLLPGWGASARALWPFYRSEFLIVGAILLPSAADGWIFLAALLALALRGQWELFTLFGQSTRTVLFIGALVAGAGLVGVSMFAPARLRGCGAGGERSSAAPGEARLAPYGGGDRQPWSSRRWRWR